MLARIRKAAEDKDQGFTLIELLVVMIIIGILAAIAIPVFLNQRKNAVDSSMKSDLRTIANELESVYTDTEAYPLAANFTSATTTNQTTTIDSAPTPDVTTRTSKGNTFVYTLNTANDAFCVVASNTKGNHPWVYVSSAGGLQASGANSNACPGTY